MRPNGGLKPTMPHADAGMRIDPPISLPVAKVVAPEAKADALPPDEPPPRHYQTAHRLHLPLPPLQFNNTSREVRKVVDTR